MSCNAANRDMHRENIEREQWDGGVVERISIDEGSILIFQSQGFYFRPSSSSTFLLTQINVSFFFF